MRLSGLAAANQNAAFPFDDGRDHLQHANIGT
jgi:hypothetical protein